MTRPSDNCLARAIGAAQIPQIPRLCCTSQQQKQIVRQILKQLLIWLKPLASRLLHWTELAFMPVLFPRDLLLLWDPMNPQPLSPSPSPHPGTYQIIDSFWPLKNSKLWRSIHLKQFGSFCGCQTSAAVASAVESAFRKPLVSIPRGPETAVQVTPELRPQLPDQLPAPRIHGACGVFLAWLFCWHDPPGGVSRVR